MNTTTTEAAAEQPLTIKDITRSIFNSVHTALIEDYRNGRYGEAATEMFPAKMASENDDLSDEDERAVTARIRDDVERFKSSVADAVGRTPAEEEGFIDVKGVMWSTPDPQGTHPVPFKPEWHVYTMFARGDDSIACYVFPAVEKGPTGKVVTFARLMLSRHTGSASWKPLTLSAFKAEIVDELVSGYYDYWGDDGHLDKLDEAAGSGEQPS